MHYRDHADPSAGFKLANIPRLVVGYGNETRFLVQPAVKHFLEFMPAVRLGEDFVHTGLTALLAVRFGGIRSQRDDWNPRVGLFFPADLQG